MDLLKLKTKKGLVSALVLLSAVFFASGAVAQDHMMPGAGAGAGAGAGTITVQDINFDQILDIITSGGPGNALNVFLGNGDGTFNQMFQAGLGLGVNMGLIEADDVPMITFYQNMMAMHLISTCSGGDLGLPPELIALLSSGGNTNC